ncbi:hypothetical protein [Nostoc sp.]|uniref:hypothetical protein n=1 Tax=Nostoc sp. TaxID=1180 RepID=UPI003593B09F
MRYAVANTSYVYFQKSNWIPICLVDRMALEYGKKYPAMQKASIVASGSTAKLS